MVSLVKTTYYCISMMLVLLSFSSCSVEHVDVKDIEKDATQMMECLVNNDSDGLFGFYSDYMKNNYRDESLEEIQELFDYIDGAIISYDYQGRGGGREDLEGHEIVYYSCYPEFDFTTNTGKTYTVNFSYQYICDETPEYEGVHRISICEDGDWKTKLVIGKNYNDN